jgi:hypothetical protein
MVAVASVGRRSRMRGKSLARELAPAEVDFVGGVVAFRALATFFRFKNNPYLMIYKEENFVGKDRKPFLTTFVGTIESVKKQASGNLIVLLVKTKAEEDEEIKREAIFKKSDIDAYHLDEFLKEGKSIAVYGVFTKKRSIFPVCFVKVKVGNEIKAIEIAESQQQYKIALEQAQKAQQTDLDHFKKS